MEVRKNRSPASKIVYYYWKILGMCPFVTDKSEIIQRSTCGTIYSTVLIIFLTFLYQRIMRKRWAFSLPRETRMIIITDAVGLGLEYVVITITWLYGIIYQNELRVILKAFRSTKNTAVLLGMVRYYDDFSLNLDLYVVAINCMFFTIYAFEHTVAQYIPEFDMELWLTFNLQRCVSLNMVAVVVYSLKTIEARFRFINFKIQEFPYHGTYENFRSTTDDMRKRLEAFNQLHRELENLVSQIIKLFSLPLLIALMMQFSQFIANIYSIIMFIDRGNYEDWKVNLWISVIFGWLVMRLIQMLCVIDACGATCQTANRIGNYLHTMWVLRRPQYSNDVVKILSLRFFQKALKIQLYGSIQLNESLFYQMSGVITTYLIIMIQLDGQTQLFKKTS